MADLPSGPTRVVREFQSNATFALVALPGPSQALQTGRPAASPTEVPTPPPEAGVPIVPLGAGALVLVAVLYRFTRARRRS